MADPAPASTALYDLTSGKRVDFGSGAEATQAVLDGRAAPRKTQRVPIRLPDGQTGTVLGDELHGATKAGAVLLTPDEHRKAELDARYATGGLVPSSIKDVQHQLAVSGAGALRGATLGLSDKAIIEAQRLIHGEKGASAARQTLQEMAEAHPIQSVVNEVLGNAAATVGTGGAEGAGIAKGLPAGVLAELGGGAERAALKALGGEAPTVGGRVVQKALTTAARGAVEGAAFGGAQAYDEGVLGDHELTGQKLYTSIGMGALVGAGGGMVLGGGGELAREGLARAAGKIAPKLREMAGEQMWKALSPAKKMTEEAERRAGGTAAVGRTVLEEIGNVDAGITKTAISRATPEELHPLIVAARARVGSEIGEKLAATSATVSPRDLVGSIEEVIAPLRGKALHEGIVASLDEARLSVMKGLGMIDGTTGLLREGAMETPVPVQKLIEQTRAVQDIAFKETKALDPKLRVEYLREISGRMRDVEAKAIDQAAKEIGGPTAAEVKTLYKKFQQLSIAEKAAEKSTSKYATNRNLSASDYGAALMAFVSGHPLAAPVAAIGHHLVRERGNATLAVGLDKLADLGVLRELSARADERAERAVAGFMKSSTTPRLRARTLRAGETSDEEPLHDRYRVAVRRVNKLASDNQLPSSVSAQLGGVGRFAPKTSMALTQSLTRAIQFLRSKTPSTPIPSQLPAIGMQTVPRVPDVEMARFLRYERAAVHPETVLDDLQHGKVTPEAVEALKVVAPKVFAELQARVMSSLNEESAKKQIPYDQRLRLSVLFEAPADESMRPQMVGALQSNFKSDTPPDGGNKASGPAPKRPVQKLAASERLETDRLEQAGP